MRGQQRLQVTRGPRLSSVRPTSHSDKVLCLVHSVFHIQQALATVELWFFLSSDETKPLVLGLE